MKSLAMAIVAAVLSLAAHPALAGAPPQAAKRVYTTPPAAQAPAPPPQAPDPKRAEEIKRRVERMAVGARITVVLEHGDDLHGALARVDATTFEVDEVDRLVRVTVRYDEVKKVRKGYGEKNLFTGKRPNPLWGYVALAALVGFVAISLGQLD